ncbi:hypothetical protein CHRY9390_01263 [Chryseobacterium aquaeductus]|uniref:Uncharacterized protein n=1 Tax=Chryseobacterium aquaeductus TaxID=2675056 RepID=A0A9N8MMJ1_9FLAO|nr:hypothetical protein [Chryseobacterium aquaeductus]CAA7330592.1 hypothetical protein CHRY9390_01263 [Chryseobacterium potabilaquae]CAD7804713.1 hypothetical protein CHRY9390_01263 [Chryseobacterium aquaeductus]
MKSKEELKRFFENGDIPKQEEFWEWQDSYWHKDEKIQNTIPLSGTADGDNVTGKITSEAPVIIEANWDNIEPNNGARLSQVEGFVIDKGNKTTQVQADSLRIIDNSAEGGGQ